MSSQGRPFKIRCLALYGTLSDKKHYGVISFKKEKNTYALKHKKHKSQQFLT